MIVSECHKESVKIIETENGGYLVCTKCEKPTTGVVSLDLGACDAEFQQQIT